MVLLDVVKQEIGWEGGISLPVANQKNKELEKEIQLQIREITLAKSQLDSQNEHVKILSKHLASVQEQLVETQNLKQAKQLEIKSEKDFQALLKTQESRTKQEKRRLQRELEALLEKKTIHQNSVSKSEARINAIREEIHWDEVSMNTWLEEAIRKDEDSNLLQAYASEDNSKIKELELQLEKLTAVVQRSKKTLDRKAIDFKMEQVDFDKTTAGYRTLHEQRKNYIRQWETTIEQMHDRDEEVENYISELMKLKHKAASTNERLREQELVLQERTANNGHVKQRIRAIERAQVQLKQQLADEDKKGQAAEKELHLLNTTMNDASADLDHVKSQTQQLVGAIKQQNKRIARNNEQMKVLKANMSDSAEVFTTSETEVQRMDVRMAVYRARLSALQSELAEVQKKLAAHAEQLRTVCDQEKNVSSEIQSLKGVERRVDATNDQLSREIYNHQQMLCIQDNEIRQLAERISCVEGSGDRSVGSRQSELQDKVKFLQKVLDDKTASMQALVQETKQQERELRTAQEDIDNLRRKNQQIAAQLDEVNLQNDVGHKKLKKTVVQKQKLMVDENILKLELRRFREILISKSINVVSMEDQRMRLEAAIQERQQEIAIEKEITKTEVRMLEEARQKMVAEVNDCRKKTIKLKSRCEVVLQPVRNWNCDGEATPVHFLMKVAEDKKRLKSENEALLSKVQRAEKDVTTFQRRARLLNAKNECLRKALHVTPATNEAMENFKEEKRKLDEEVSAAVEKLDSTKRQYNAAKESLMKQEDSLECIRAVEREAKDDWARVQGETASLDAELGEQQAKINRARQTLSRINHQLRHQKHYERVREDVALRLIREQNRNAVDSLVDFMEKFPEAASAVNACFDKAQLPRPTKSRTGALSSTAGSVRTLPSVNGRRSSDANSTTSSTTGGRRTPSKLSSSTLPSVVNINIITSSASRKSAGTKPIKK